ncbi:glucose 1-dehydrogenase/3-oxoacyl-[acyl-carrier protein] reductase [Virgibacillus subterraneus]|uniref:Glucose 1-dehydrogenase/3-oxoacyl-[acyl-carrier protein] reductase n=1 Tax=Virgibacillus subterraneus TaxID=621109 RepID=A0A1H9G6L4_9BACI|nr:SDR family oxidoreductase [Virgibacillus subterraneus]SEQ45704.1 glucose 1-dehydrogenase/3-oxoacyl-[acyl-carrier protein] reductase [Virgibacillus subterraneus]
MRLAGKTALITGGSLGIGRAVALCFAQEGAKVAISGRGKEALEETASIIRSKGGEALSIVADVQSKSEIDRMVDYVLKSWGRIDILINNAGICHSKPVLDITEEEWDQHLDINLKGTFLSSQRVAREWVKRGEGGNIVNMSSVNGIQAEDNQAHYNTSKGGINLLTMSMALELAEKDIRVNALCPGFIETRLTRPAIQNRPVIKEYLKTIPMKRVGLPEDIAGAALFMASDDSRYMTGHCLVVDGGQVIKLS